ncbi:MAG TPA: glycosyl hydrolase 108 family protein, partial [Candidatus Binatia bacterium]|nr:glycosyl hydrolase 108 family protein [Candidatus Binatia bacterium]
MADLGASLKKLRPIEGLYSHDPRDVGAETVHGIARRFWPDWDGWLIVDRLRSRPDFPRCLALGAAAEQLELAVSRFYRKEFWTPIAGDELRDQAIADELFEQ